MRHSPSHCLLGPLLGPHGDGLTPSDVHLNRLLRGPDIYRAQSRVRDPPALPSTSPPAPRPCHTLVIDPHLLKHPDIFGNKYKILICCEFTGALYVIPSKTGTAASMNDGCPRPLGWIYLLIYMWLHVCGHLLTLLATLTLLRS